VTGLIVALGATVACGPVRPSTTPLAFALDGPTLRLLHTGEETMVAVTVRNTGQRTWDDARIHLSYHWLWIVPRELARRSRNVPYHDGIRTVFGTDVLPGGRVQVEGRILAPEYPGLYWLQWDMVEEDVTWFAQVSPRQPRRLVVVLPSLAGAFAPLPLLVALVGALALASGARSRSTVDSGVRRIADLAWCAAALLAKPFVLVREALLEPTWVAYWLMLMAAIIVPLLGMLALPRRARAWALFACGVLGTLLMLGDGLYYQFFGDVLSAPAMLAVRQTGHVSGSIRSLLAPTLLWLVADLPVALWMTILLTRATRTVSSPRRTRVALVLALVVIVGVLPTVPMLQASRLDQMFRARAVVERLGPFGYHAYDAWTYARTTWLRPKLSTEQLADVEAWFASRARLRAGVGPSFGIASGRNVIVIQVESLQDFVVDYRVKGQDVMPHLARWSDHALRFTNVTDQTSEGRTSDAEFSMLTSLAPLDHGAAAFRYAGNHFIGLPSVLGEHGYTTMSAVPFESGFWNRRVMHPAYGFQQSLFEPDFHLTEQIGWGLNDRDFLQQMVPRLEHLQRPFAAWLITLSLHHPFDDFPEAHKSLSLGALDHTSFGNYLHTMRFFDTALADFEASLARAGVLDDSVLVVFGDHDAGFARDRALAATMGIGASPASWELSDRVPVLIKLPRTASRSLVGQMTMPAGQVDVAPTLLALLGIDAARLPYAGQNLLGEPDDSPVVRPYGDWLDGAHLFMSRSDGEGGGDCYTTGAVRADLSSCQIGNRKARHERDVLRWVVAEDLQPQLRDGLRGP
jgi:phosphoglycerol transferase MdoB-like AlkP superfamily enzyme